MHSTIRRYNTDISTRSASYRTSDDSQDSQSTAPTLYTARPSLLHAHTDKPVFSETYGVSPATTYSSYCPRSSAETYRSEASQEDLFEEPETYDPEYDVPEYQVTEDVSTNLRPSTPSDFAELFPTSRKMYIRHDDSTWDGNMNVRVDTEDIRSQSKANVQLFHLKMQDLKNRDFSLRRYERSSGREVCHSTRKYVKQSEHRPGLTRSMSNAFANITRTKPVFQRTSSTQSSRNSISVRRQDSGYGSEQGDDEVGEFMSEKRSSVKIPTNTTKLDFSNYAQVEVTRRGAKSSKRYEFEYWGSLYKWKRIVEKVGAGKVVSYHLFKGDGGPALVHIIPELRTMHQIEVEEAAGGWMPPCYMRISDKSILEALNDVADVVVATGLIALIDDSIKRRFHTKPRSRQVAVPLTQLKMDFVGPKVMVDHIFKRENSGGSLKQGSPLKNASPLAAS
ncbi:hypothetical protein BJ878DRAFT_533658 [Calycina marina]|uniref:Uncharacterized protein n=1 Tax=Calycina marina TaxID=1763456 RepID=A0A9P7Z6J0_9HELO|nr:hypothetical protein BJ878DRAFT_533658 [Calycina marina]